MGAWRVHAQNGSSPAVDYWQSTAAWWDVVVHSRLGKAAINVRARRRCAELIRFVLSRSVAYARLLGMRNRGATPALEDLPPVNKAQLMAEFDDWVTDAAVTRRGIERFIAEPGRAGEAFHGRYGVWTSSGTSGEPGIFVHDTQALAVYDALEAARFRRLETPWSVLSTLLGRERYAMVGATGGHFAGNAMVARVRRANPWLRDRVRMFSIMDPIEELTRSLNEYKPTLLATYPSSAVLLARQAERGALRIQLRELWTGGESLYPCDREALERGFHCPVRDDYGSSEFLPIAFECSRGTLHVNADWVMLEPVDAQYRAVDPGQRSHTVLLTNLANFVQPLIRYDLGDSVTVLEEACPCGSPFPAIRLEGRRDDVLVLQGDGGDAVTLLPLALATVLEEEADVYRFQLVQTGAAALRLRLPAAAGQRRAWAHAEKALRRYLAAQGLTGIRVERDPQPLALDPRSGKCRRILRMTPEPAPSGPTGSPWLPAGSAHSDADSARSASQSERPSALSPR